MPAPVCFKKDHKGMVPALLTIGIPTYNRADTIRANLSSIIDRLPAWVEILVCDNASEPAVVIDVVTLATAAARGVRIRIVRHPTNLGAPANILRLFELAETPWLLLAGDDDPVLPERLDDILALTKRHPDCAIVKFGSPYGGYAEEQVVRNFQALMRDGGNFNQLLFMSTFLFQIAPCRHHLRFAYMMAISAASQVAILLMAAAANEPILLSPLTVTRARDEEPAWSPADTRLNFYALADLPLNPDQRRLLRARIYSSHNLFREVLDLAAIMRVDRAEAEYLRRKSRAVHRIHGRGAKSWLSKVLVPASAMIGPSLLNVLMRLYARAKGRPYQHIFVNRHDRL